MNYCHDVAGETENYSVISQSHIKCNYTNCPNAKCVYICCSILLVGYKKDCPGYYHIGRFYHLIHRLLSYRQLSLTASDKTLLENTRSIESGSSALNPLA